MEKVEKKVFGSFKVLPERLYCDSNTYSGAGRGYTLAAGEDGAGEKRLHEMGCPAEGGGE